jgi:ankyrin repeat protein
VSARVFKRYLKFAFQAIVLAGIVSAYAGSYEDFFIAIRNDSADELKSLLQRGVDPNSRDPKGQPGLTVSMQEHALKAAEVLLAQPDIDVNAPNAAAESPLMMAALKGDLQGCQMLLAKGAKVNLSGWSPLHYAATGPSPAVVRLLLDRGAAVNALSPNGTTPLMMAAQYGSEESLRLLLKRGADWKRRNERGLDAADFAQLAGRMRLAQQLRELHR